MTPSSPIYSINSPNTLLFSSVYNIMLLKNKISSLSALLLINSFISLSLNLFLFSSLAMSVNSFFT